MIAGMNRLNGKPLTGLDHIKQSITDILTTPIGSRIMLPEYGSRLFQLIDAPISSGLVLDVKSAVIEAIHKWEPRVRVISIELISASPIEFSLELILIDSGATTQLQVTL